MLGLNAVEFRKRVAGFCSSQSVAPKPDCEKWNVKTHAMLELFNRGFLPATAPFSHCIMADSGKKACFPVC